MRDPDRHASTGPSMVIDGENAIVLDPIAGHLGFNGAVDGDRRRVHRAPHSTPPRRCFNGAVDGDRRRALADVVDEWRLLASTGPSMVIDGEAEGCAEADRAHACFNGAVDGDRRRGDRTRFGSRGRQSFNGAVDGDRRRVAQRPLADLRERASTGPSMVIDGENLRQSSSGGAGNCFNGAVDGDRRRGSPCVEVSAREAASTGPSMVIDGE